MNELSRESRALLAAARNRDGLSTADKDRIRGNITRRIGAGLALGSAVTASATVAEAAHTTVMATVASWLPAAAKVLGVVALAGGVTVGVVRVSHPAAPPSAAAAPAVRIASPARVEVAARPVAPVTQPVAAPENPAQQVKPEVLQPAAPVRELSAPVKRDVRSANTPLGVTESQPATQAAVPVDDGLSSQVAAIREARAAIRRGDGRAALAAIDRGLPQGQAGPLEQEATLARVSALCLLGDVTTARRTAEQFLARFPGSLLAARVRSSCAFGSADSP